MSAVYDRIGRAYRLTKQSALREVIEAHTLMDLLGAVRGLDVLDLGCGEGTYARRLKGAGAARLLGVDVSETMIGLAREQEAAAPAGIEYLCRPAEDLGNVGRFDVVLAVYLLHYAPSREILARMCAWITSSLRPGGRLVALVENPEQSVERYAGYEPYGFSKVAVEPRREGARIRYAMAAGRQLIRFDTCYYARDTYERLLGNAGLAELCWHRPVLSPEAADAGYWQAYLDNPPVLGLTARRAPEAPA